MCTVHGQHEHKGTYFFFRMLLWVFFSVNNAQTSAFNVSQSVWCVSASVDSTESSGECINVCSSSDHSCLSAISGEIVDDSSSFISQSSKPCPPLCRTPSLRRNSSPAITRRKPGVAPKPPHLANAQVQAQTVIQYNGLSRIWFLKWYAIDDVIKVWMCISFYIKAYILQSIPVKIHMARASIDATSL